MNVKYIASGEGSIQMFGIKIIKNNSNQVKLYKSGRQKGN